MKTRNLSILQLMQMFPDEATAKAYYERVRWNGEPVCPHCGCTGNILKRKGRASYKCRDCKREFTVKSGTIFEDTKIPLHQWFIAMYLMSIHKKGVSSHQLSRDTGVTQKTAWFMLHRIQELSLKDGFDIPATSRTQADEYYCGGLEKNKHLDKKTAGSQGRSTKSKTPVLGIRNSFGEVYAQTVTDVSAKTIQPIINRNVRKRSILMTDEANFYGVIGRDYNHQVVNHKMREFAKGPKNRITVNGVENYWSHLSRMIIGIHHHVSPEHLDSYISMQSFRYNTCRISDGERWEEVVSKSEGKRLTWNHLTNRSK